MQRLAKTGALLLVLSAGVIAAAWGDKPRKRTAEVRASLASAEVLRGFNFTHEGFRRGGRGYGSDEADGSMARLRALGANSVAIVPYAFMRDPNVPTPLAVPASRRGENDERVVQAIASAQRHGMAILLKPQIWLRGSWPGEISMRSDGDWDTFFEHYEQWIIHYAELAEEHSVDVLSVGVEMGKATVGHESRWVALADRVREVYSGRLVYAANWYGEFEELGFWQAFDYIGVDTYYPLSRRQDPSDDELLQGAREVMAKLEAAHRRFDRPVMLTEVGFASTEAPWREPHSSDRVRQPNPEHQARSYEAMIAALDGKSWVAGVYWWKWPSHGRDAGPEHRGFSPVGKPAADVLARWLGGER